VKRSVARGLLGVALASSVSLRAGDLPACGGVLEGPVYINARNPDLPLSRYASGRVGVVGPWETSFRVVAYRLLAQGPLTEAETAAFVGFERSVHRGTDPRAIDPVVAVESAVEGSDDARLGEYVPDADPWRVARAEALGSRGPDIPNGWSTDGAWTPNCLADSFRSAAAALRERVGHYGARSDAVRAWVDAQDAVFSNCGPTPGRAPIPLQAAAPEEQRRDRAYQIAAADFYAGRYDEAERGFTAIAADAGSPWSTLARYLALRTITRAAQRGRETPDPARLERAARATRALLADPSGAAVHDMTRRYGGWIDALRDPGARLHALGAELLQTGRADRLADDLHDYTLLYESSAALAARRTPSEADPLTAWMAAPGEPGGAASPRDAALARFARGHQPQWLIAALQSPGDPRDRRLDPVIAAARAVPRSDVAFASAQYGQLRLRVERGERVHGEVVRTSHELSDADGPTARNLFRELALRAARDVDQFTSVAYGRPAGWSAEGSLVVPPTPGRDGTVAEDFSPLAAAVLSQRVPVEVLLSVARNPTLPLALRERVTGVALHRAALLGDETSFAAASALLPRMSEEAARPLRALAQGPTADARRFELVRSLLMGGGAWRVSTSMIDEEPTDSDPWASRCGEAPPAVVPAWFLSAAGRAALGRERARQAATGDAPTWLASEAARLAPRMIAEPRMPAVLAAAIANTRNNGCAPAAPVHRASRAAFQALHRLFPRSREARAARYWY
jgi:hypothetical protein